jgi:hypothetical protein
MHFGWFGGVVCSRPGCRRVATEHVEFGAAAVRQESGCPLAVERL